MAPMSKSNRYHTLAAALTIIKIPGHSRLDSLEAKGNHLPDISSKITALKGTNGQTSVTVQRHPPQDDNLEKLTRNA